MKANRSMTGLLTGMALGALVLRAAAGATLHVEPNGLDDEGRDGLSWAQAFASIHYAVDKAFAGDTVLVSNGVYEATGSTTINKELTVESLNGAAHTVLDGMGGDYNALIGSGNNKIVLRGLTITNFLADGNNGGAIRPGADTEWHIHDCVITGNGAAGSYGGGINLTRRGLVYLYDCVISGNTGSHGGGIHLVNSRHDHSGITELYAFRTTISSNTVSGGIWIAGQGIVELDNCRIIGNTAGGNGGGINVVADSERLIINNSVISGNVAGNRGGGLHICNMEESVVLKNSLITGNSAGAGGGLYFSRVRDVVAEIHNCTIVDNYAGSSGGGYAKWTPGTETFVNSIVYFNTVESGTSSNYSTTSGITFTNCIIAPDVGAAGTDCYVVDPELDTEFKPVKGSPTINAGLYQAWMDDATDLAGNRRILMGTVDIGAYEYVPAATLLMVR